MNLSDILAALFPLGHQVTVTDKRVSGTAQTATGPITVLGTTDAAAINHAIALGLAHDVLHTVEHHPQQPILFLVDTAGQMLSRSEELLTLNGTFAHLAKTVDLARRQGHPIVSLVTANAVSGGFLSFGLMADKVYALASAEVRVMDLKAMAKVTKLAHEQLQALAQTSPIFAPGAENFQRMGAIEAIWPAPSADLLANAISLARQTSGGDLRMQLGAQRGGRSLAESIAQAVEFAE